MEKKRETLLSFAALGIAVALALGAAIYLLPSSGSSRGAAGVSSSSKFRHAEDEIAYWVFFGFPDPDAPKKPAKMTNGGTFARIPAKLLPPPKPQPPIDPIQAALDAANAPGRYALHVEPMRFLPDGRKPGYTIAADSVATENTFEVPAICFISAITDLGDAKFRIQQGRCPSLYFRDPKNPQFGAAVLPWFLKNFSQTSNSWEAFTPAAGYYDTAAGQCVQHKSAALRQVLIDRRIAIRDCYRGVWFFPDDLE